MTTTYQFLSLALVSAPFAKVALLTALAALGTATFGIAEVPEEEEEEDATNDDEDGTEEEEAAAAAGPEPPGADAPADRAVAAPAATRAAFAIPPLETPRPAPTGTAPGAPAAGATAAPVALNPAPLPPAGATAAAPLAAPAAADAVAGGVVAGAGPVAAPVAAAAGAVAGAAVDAAAGGGDAPPAEPPAPAGGEVPPPSWHKWVWATIAALVAIAAIFGILAYARCSGVGGAMTAGSASASSSAPASSSSAAVAKAGSLCPTGYTELEVARNSCQYLGWDGMEAPYEVGTQPEPGSLVVCRNKPQRDKATGAATLTLSQGCALCWPANIPLGAEIAANDVTWPVLGQHADKFIQLSWYTDCHHDWATRCGMQIKDPGCVKANADGSNDLRTCTFIVPRPVL